MLDLVIRDGQLVDGTGAARRMGDVGIRDGRIASVGTVDEPAAETISADGAVVAPGFIDPHTHYDAQVFWDPALTPSSLHGVTTVIGGNCGFSVAPLSPDSADYLMRMLARVEGMPLASLAGGLRWDWGTTSDYLERLEGAVALNAGFMVGHSAIRRIVMGEAASERQATSAELETMKGMLRAGLAAGGLGFSSSLAQSHSDAAGNPVPSRFAAFGELLEFAAVCGEFEGTSLEIVPHTGPEFPEAIKALLVDMSLRARRPLNWNIINIRAGNEAEIEGKLAVSNRARAAGGEVIGLVMPLPIATRLNFESGFLLDMLPGWSRPMALPHGEKLRLLANREQRAKLRRLAAQDCPMSHFAQWAEYLIYESFTPETTKYAGRTVGEIAKEDGKDPFDALVDIVIADDLRTSFGRPVRPDTQADWKTRQRVLRDDRAVVGASDAGAHLDMISTFSYTTQLLEHAVRQHQVVTTEEAVHLLTQVPAELFGLRNRGVLRAGNWADLVIFDEGSVGSGPVHTRHDLPGGAGRLFAEAKGVTHVLVNGQPVTVGGEVTGRRPGRILRSGRDTFSPALRRNGSTGSPPS